MANDKRSNIYRDHVIQKQFKDILSPILAHRDTSKNSVYYKFFIDALKKETIDLQPKTLRKFKTIPSMLDGLWIKTDFPAAPSPDYTECNTYVEIKGAVTYENKNYSVFAQIVFPQGFQYEGGKLLPICSYVSKDCRDLLKAFTISLVKVNGIYFIRIELPYATEALDNVQEILYEVYSEHDAFTLEDPAGSQELIFKSEEIMFGSVADHDAVTDTDKLVRSDTIRWLVVTEQDKYDEMLKNGTTKKDELYHVKESYIENPTIPPTEQPRPDRVTLAVKFNDAFIWSQDYDIDTQVPESDITLPAILGYKFKEYRTKPLGEQDSVLVTFPIVLDETKVIYAIYEEVIQLKGIVWENTVQLLTENINSGDDWDPRPRVPARTNYYTKYFNDSNLTEATEFPILVIDENINIYTLWKYGFYFESREDFDDRIDKIIEDNNGDLSDFEFEFSDDVDVLDYLFYRKKLTGTPKIITSKAKSAIGTFQECSNLTKVSDTVYGNCPNIKNFTDSFKDDTAITTKVPDLWNRYPEGTVGTNCFTNCINTPNRKEIPVEWGGLVWRTIRVLNYLDDTLIKTIDVEDGTVYDLLTISETYDSTGVWGAFFEDKARTKRIYDPIAITASKDYYAEWDKFDYYFNTFDEFKSQIQSISNNHDGDLSEISIGFAPGVNTIVGTTTNITTLKKLPKYMWANINSANPTGVFGLTWKGFYINEVPKTYFYFMSRIKQINGFVDSQYGEHSNNPLIPEGLLEHQIHLNTITNLYKLNVYTDYEEKTVMKSVDMPSVVVAGEEFEATVEFDTEYVDIIPDHYPGLTLPSDLLLYAPELNTIDGLVIGGRFETIDPNFFNRTTNLQIAKNLFKENNKLTGMPANLFDPCQSLKDLTNAFYNCTAMTGYLPALWNRTPAIPTGTDCFKNCNKTTNWTDVPVEWGGDPITTKEVTIKFMTTVAGSKIVGSNVPENATEFPMVAIAQLEDNSAIVPGINGAYGTSEFIGWSTESTGTEEPAVLYKPGSTIIIPDFEITVYAWFKKSITVNYNGNSHGNFAGQPTTSQSEVIYPNINDKLTVQPKVALTPEAGYEFVEWNTAANGGGTGYANGATIASAGTLDDTLSFYAKWNDVRQTLTIKSPTNITYNGTSALSHTISLPKPFALPTMTVANQSVNGHQGVFDFFAEATSGTTPTAQYKVGSTIPESVTTLNAWFKVASLSITLNMNYSGGTNATQTWNNIYTNNQATTNYQIINVPTREYYIFKGWATSATGAVVYQSNTNITDILTKFAPNTTLYAIWEGESVTVNYNLNGGTIDGQTTYSVEAKIGDTITIINKTPIKTGYTFTHWEDKLKNRYNAGDQFIVTPDKLN